MREEVLKVRWYSIRLSQGYGRPPGEIDGADPEVLFTSQRLPAMGAAPTAVFGRGKRRQRPAVPAQHSRPKWATTSAAEAIPAE